MNLNTDTNSTNCCAQELRIVAGITPNDVETLLSMAAVSGLFTSDVMMSTEDMAWDSAYGSGKELHSFLKATLGAPEEERTIGFICYGAIPHWPGYYEMYCIAVELEFQRLGIGSALLSEMHRQVAYEGGYKIFLETSTDRVFENARLFYEANNFVQEHRYIKQFVPNNGGIVYRFDIDSEQNDEQYQ